MLTTRPDCLKMFHKPARVAVLAGFVSLLASTATKGHELWIETAPAAKAGQAHPFHVCWGHTGNKVSGQFLKAQHGKTSTRIVLPDGSHKDLKTTLEADCFLASVTPAAAGYYLLASELQTGIISKQLHSIPPNTRIIMYGKTLAHVAGSQEGLTRAAGFDLEIIPLTALEELRPGGVARAKLLFYGKPLGGRGVELSLGTAGPEPLPEHRRIQSHQWSIDAMPDPRTGEVAFPLIAAGRHVFAIRYFDETPGTYNGTRDDHSDFSHLRKGDKYERTMYVSTLTVSVEAK